MVAETAGKFGSTRRLLPGGDPFRRSRSDFMPEWPTSQATNLGMTCVREARRARIVPFRRSSLFDLFRLTSISLESRRRWSAVTKDNGSIDA